MLVPFETVVLLAPLCVAARFYRSWRKDVCMARKAESRVIASYVVTVAVQFVVFTVQFWSYNEHRWWVGPSYLADAVALALIVSFRKKTRY